MKKVSKISLGNLSKVELSDKEMSLINGGYGNITRCLAICFDAICRCVEDAYGEFSTSEGITKEQANSSDTDVSLLDQATKMPTY